MQVENVDNETPSLNQPKNQLGKRENLFYLILFLIVCLGGAIRKWVTTDGTVANSVLLFQMVLPFVIFFLRSNSAVSPFQNFKLLGFYFFYLILQIFNPYQMTIFHGILGILVHGGLWLAFFLYFSNRHLFRPAQLMKLILIVSIGEILLAFIQYQLPADNVLNKYALESMKNIATVGDRVRVTGSFSYLGGFTAFLLFFPFFIWALIRLNYNSWIISTASIFGMVASFMSGSRGATLLYIVLIGPIFLKEYNAAKFIKFIWALILPIIIGGAILLTLNNVTLFKQMEKAYDNFADRVENGQKSGEQAQRLGWDLFYLQTSHFESPIFGIGTGATYQGAIAIFGVSPYLTDFGYVENEFIRILLEGGIIIIIFKILLATTVVQNLRFKGLLRLIIWIILMYGAPITFNVHNAAFLFLGITLIDNIYWRQQMEAARKKAEWDAENPVDDDLVLLVSGNATSRI